MPLEAVQLLYTERAIGRGAAAITTELTQRECFEHGGRGDRPCGAAHDWWHGLQAGMLRYNPLFTGSLVQWNASDGEWVEVLRTSTACAAVGSACEGFSAGGVRRQGVGRMWPHHGCWFFVASGTNVFVNVDRRVY